MTRRFFRSVALTCAALIVAPAVAQFGGGGGGGLGGGGGGFGGGGLGGGGMGGVYMDAEGVVRALKKKPKIAKSKSAALNEEIAKRSDLRQVSLKNIDAQLRKHLNEGGSAANLPEELRTMAGLYRIDYLVLDRKNNDVLLCGPAEGWARDLDGRAIGKVSKRPSLDVADVAVALRCVLAGDGEIKCSIDPKKSGLAKALDYEMPTSITGEKAEAEQIRSDVEERLGMQIVTTGGVPTGSRFARAIVDADYRMKRIAMGFDRVPGLYTHLDAVSDIIATGAKKTNLARWWFTPNYDGVECDGDHTTFRLLGQGMKLLNEEELVDESGNRTGTGRSGSKWDRFSQAFTRMLPHLEKTNTAFADLHNLYDLSMIAGVIKKEGCGDWLRGSALLDDKAFAIPTEVQPKFAEPVVTTRVLRRVKGGEPRLFISIALGGVSMNPSAVVGAPGFIRTGGGSSSSSSTGHATSSTSSGSTASGASSGTTKGKSAAAKESAPLKPVARAVTGENWWSDPPSSKD